jgi:hypothetical protein
LQAIAVDAAGNREVVDMAFAQKVTITNVIPPALADISLVQVAGMPIPPITLEASADLRPVSGQAVIDVAKAQAATALMLVSTSPLMWSVPADINLNDPSIVATIEGESIDSFTFAWDAMSLASGQYFISFILRSGPPVVLQDLIDIATIVDNTTPEVTFVAPTPGSTLGFRPVAWVKYNGTGSEIYAVNFELKDDSGTTVLTPGVAEGVIEGVGAEATYVIPSLNENGFSLDNAKLIYKVPELLEAGGYTAMVKVTDLARNSAAAEISFVVGQDTSPPIITVTSPQGTITVSEVILSVSAVDDTGVASVALKLDGVEIPPADVQLVDGVATSKVTGLEAGEHQVEAMVVDKVGNKASATWGFIVEPDATPPQISVVSPQGVIHQSEATIAVAVTDESGIENVLIKLNDVEVPGVVLLDGIATAQVSDLQDGEQQVLAEVTDIAGNKASAMWIFTVELDTTPPQITVASPQGTVYQNSATISATITDESGINGTPVIRVDGSARSVTFSNSVATATATGLSSGEHQVELTATDNSGNTASAKWSFTVKLDTTPPQITVASPQGTVYQASVTISATITDESGIDGTPTIEVDGNSISVTFSDGVATADATGLDSSGHQAKVTATDNAGNTVSAEWTFTVMLDTIPPAITAISPLGTVRVEKPTISVAVSDDSSGVDSIDISLEDAGGKSVSLKEVSSDESSAVYTPSSALKAGTYTVTAEAEDVAGNSSSAEWTFTVEFDLVPPVITIISPQDGARTTDARQMLSASYSDNLAGVDEKSIVLKVDGQDVTAKASAKNVNQIIYTPDSDLSIGKHTINLEVEDNDDNKASVTWSFIVESETAGIVNPRNYPNPFQGQTTIAFKLTQQSQVTIQIFDFSGRLVKMLKDDEIMEAGPYEIAWDGKSEDGDDLARGVYFGMIIMKTELEPQRAVLKMALTR